MYIFSGADKKPEIEIVLAKHEFQEYKERLHYLDKAFNGTDQTTVLLQNAEQLYDSNFSFRFANILRIKGIQTIDKILSDMGKLLLNDIKNHIVIGDGGKKDLIDFLTEKFRSKIASREIYDILDKIPEPTQEARTMDDSIVKKMWSYRLYFQRETGDDLVRCGDIVKVEDDFHLIISADCDLGGFWKKNLGIINMVALHELKQTNITLKDWLTACVKPANIPGPVPNLLGNVGELAEGPFVLPFVPVNGCMKNFLAIPKDLISLRIPTYPGNWKSLSEKLRGREAMKYSFWPRTERLCTVSEPFLIPVIQHVLNTIAGNGVPDYSEPMKVILKNILEEFSTTARPTVASISK